MKILPLVTRIKVEREKVRLFKSKIINKKTIEKFKL